MKKFVYCISLLLAALCTTAMAQGDYNILKIEGMVPQTNGTTYYLKNVGTGLYVSYGGEWGKHCKESRAAHPFTVENNGNGLVALKSIAGYLESGTLWMDWAKETSMWTLQPVGGEYVNQYYLVGDNGLALTSVGNSAGLLRMRGLENKASQRWIFITEDEIRNNRMPKATAEKPFDVTPLIKGAAFDLVDIESYLGQSWTNFDANKKLDPWHCGICPENANDYNYCGIINGSNSAITITYKVTLPAGTYSYSFEGFYKYLKKETVQTYFLGGAIGDPSTTITDNGTMTATVSVNGISHTLARHENNAVYEENYISSTVAAAEFRDNDAYKQNGTFYLSSKKEVSIVITKPATSQDATSGSKWGGNYTTTTYPNQIFIDDFTLLYFGDEKVAEENINDDALVDSYIDANIDETVNNMFPDATEEEKEQLKEEIKETVKENVGTGNSASDLSGAIVDADNIVNDKKQEEEQEEALGNITTNEDGEMVDEEGNVIEDGQADLDAFIKNPSFERVSSKETDVYGWTLVNGNTNTGVRDNVSEFATVGADGNYIFNTSAQGVRIEQTIAKLPKGVYKMTVSLASDADNTVILKGNDAEREVTLVGEKEGDKYKFEDFCVKFRVGDNGEATISVESDSWYRADNFRLELLNDHLILNETDYTMEAGNQARAIDYWYANVTLNRTIKANGNWNTFVVPFDIPTEMLGEVWEVKELTESTLNEDGDITLTFEDSKEGIKAGVPYMVRNINMDGLTQLVMNNVNVITTLKDSETDHVTFKGVYTNGTVPIGSYFISSNKFYRCVNANNPDKLKGYRAYIEPKSSEASNARSLGYRFVSRAEDEEGATAIDNEQMTMDNETTVIAIYTLEGRRIDEMQQGVNILQMSDGSIVKVIIK